MPSVHASAVLVGARAVLIRGPSGAGKSRLASALLQHSAEHGFTLSRVESVVSTDLDRQVRVIRSTYDLVSGDGKLTRRVVEWPYRWVHRFEGELLLARSRQSVSHSSLSRSTQTRYKVGT